MLYLCYDHPDKGNTFEKAADMDSVRARVQWMRAALGVDPATIRVFDEAGAIDPDGTDPSVCPVCGEPIDQDGIDVNDNEEDGYAFVGFETD